MAAMLPSGVVHRAASCQRFRMDGFKFQGDIASLQYTVALLRPKSNFINTAIIRFVDAVTF